MLNVLKFKMTVPTVSMFLPRYVKAAQLSSDSKVTMMARYFAEKSLQEYSFIKYMPSTIAAASVSLALRVAQQQEWTPTLQHYTRYQQATLQPCIRDLVRLIRKSNTVKLDAGGAGISHTSKTGLLQVRLASKSRGSSLQLFRT